MKIEMDKMENEKDDVESQLQQMTDKLNKMLDTQQLMIANISHEMRTSLNAITGYISIINEGKVSKGDKKAYLEKASNAASTLQTLVSDILDISKLNADQMEIKNSYFWMDEIVLQSLDNILVMINKKNLELMIDVDLFPHRLLGDSQRIMEILTNLLSNAIKFTDEGFIHLSVKEITEEDDTIEILFRLEDSGIGMSAKQLKDIFEPYTRFESARQGVGLGMHISQKLAQKMDGNLTVKSVESQGTIFDFTVKLKQEKKSSICMDNSLIYFFNDTDELKAENKKRVFDQKLQLLEQFGAKVKVFTDEADFTNVLLDMQSDVPDIISFTTYHDSYIRFDALINYLKNLKKFENTYFIAEHTGTRLPLNYFDKVFDRFSTIYSFVKVIETLKKKHEEVGLLGRQNLRILAVDDIETNLEVLKLFITNKYPDAVLDMALGGYEGVGMYKTGTYDLIFMDLKMPGLSGFDVFEKLKGIKNPPPVYALTADVYKDTFDKVMTAGFAGMLEKPVKPDILFETISKVRNV